jgi:hypothetical protein
MASRLPELLPYGSTRRVGCQRKPKDSSLYIGAICLPFRQCGGVFSNFSPTPASPCHVIIKMTADLGLLTADRPLVFGQPSAGSEAFVN